MQKVRSVMVRVLEIIICLLSITLASITFAQVFCRYVLGFSLTWSHELAILLLIWTVWLCIPIGVERNNHLTMTILTDRVSGSTRKWIFRMVYVLMLAFFVLLFFLTFPVLDSFEGMLLTTIPFSVQAHYYAMLTGSLLSLFFLVARGAQNRQGG